MLYIVAYMNNNNFEDWKNIHNIDRLQREAMRMLDELKRIDRLTGADNFRHKFASDVSDLERRQNQVLDYERRQNQLVNFERKQNLLSQYEQTQRQILDSKRSQQQFWDFERRQRQLVDFEKRQEQLNRYEEIERRLQRNKSFNIDDQASNFLRHERQLNQALHKGITDFHPRDFTKELGQLERLRSDAILDTYNRQKNALNYARIDTGLPLWQKQTALALSLKEQEINDLINARANGFGNLRAVDIIPENFYQQDFWDSIDKVKDTFLGELSTSIREAITDSQNNNELFEKIELLIEQKLTTLPDNSFSKAALWQIVIGVLGVIVAVCAAALTTYQIIDSQKSSQEQKVNTDKVIEVLQKIAENTSKSTNQDSPAIYVVERDVPVKIRPKFKSLTLDYLPKETKVRLLNSNHKWIYIEYIDYFEVVPKYGWVNKKYLKKVD
jgi:hypothetical protein